MTGRLVPLPEALRISPGSAPQRRRAARLREVGERVGVHQRRRRHGGALLLRRRLPERRQRIAVLALHLHRDRQRRLVKGLRCMQLTDTALAPRLLASARAGRACHQAHCHAEASDHSDPDVSLLMTAGLSASTTRSVTRSAAASYALVLLATPSKLIGRPCQCAVEHRSLKSAVLECHTHLAGVCPMCSCTKGLHGVHDSESCHY